MATASFDKRSSESDHENSNDTLHDTKEKIQVSAQLRLPPFWVNRPTLWFIQVETQFRMNSIKSSQTKYDYVISILPPEIMELISDILTDPPEHGKYDYLKKTLIDRCQDSEERRLDALLNRLDLGDNRPSELFRKMESLAGDFKLINKALLKKLWLGKLPSTIQSCLISIEGTQTPEELFVIADKLYDATERTKISAVKHESHTDSSDSLKHILEKVCSRLEKLENLHLNQRQNNYRNNRSNSRSSSTSRSFSRNRANSRDRNETKYDYCWYHYKFAENAKKCTQPCKYNSNVGDTPKN